MRVLSLRGSSYDVGLQHGRQIRELVRGYYSLCRILLRDIPEDVLSATLSEVEDGLRRGYPEALDEMRGIAEGSRLGYEAVLLMNFTSEVRSRASSGCTAFTATDGATISGLPLMGKTRDMAFQAYFPFQIAMRVRIPGRAEVFLAEAFSGMAVTGCGMNEHGLGLTLNIIISIGDIDPSVGIQRAFMARLVLERCESVEEALDLFSETDLAYQGANFLVCDAEGECALVEKSHRHQAIMRPIDGLIAATNHFTDPGMAQFDRVFTQPSRMRLERMTSLLASKRGKIDLSMAKGFLRDHAHGHGVNSICRHEPSGVNTVQAYILEPCSREIHIADGHPCTSRFQRYSPFR